jgi:hypothetical protein
VERAWVELIRAGEALRCLFTEMKSKPFDELKDLVKAKQIAPSTLVWIGGNLAFSLEHMPCGTVTKCKVHVLGRSGPTPYRAAALPVAEIVRSGALNLSPLASQELLQFFTLATSAQR